MMMKKKPKNWIGRKFEEVFAKRFSSEKVPGSGSGIFRKMDVEGKRLLWSLKATDNESFSVKQTDLDEVTRAVKGPGGIGGSFIPVLGFTMTDDPKPTDRVFVVIEAEDFVDLLESKSDPIFQPSKTKEKYKAANVPSLFRTEDQ